MTMLNFADYEWKSPFSWREVLPADELPLSTEYANSALCVVGDTQIALFRSTDNKLFALQNLCGHRVAFVLSEGTLGVDEATHSTYVTCPLHRRKFFLDGDSRGRTKSGMARVHSIATFPVKEEDGSIWVKLPESVELDSVLGTHRWLPQRGGGPGRFGALRGGLAAARPRPAAADCAATCSVTKNSDSARSSSESAREATKEPTNEPAGKLASEPPAEPANDFNGPANESSGPASGTTLETTEVNNGQKESKESAACAQRSSCRGASDTESDSSCKSPAADQDDVCPVAETQALCW